MSVTHTWCPAGSEVDSPHLPNRFSAVLAANSGRCAEASRGAAVAATTRVRSGRAEFGSGARGVLDVVELAWCGFRARVTARWAARTGRPGAEKPVPSGR